MYLLFESQNKITESKSTKKQTEFSHQLSPKTCHNINRCLVVLLTFASVFLSGVVADIMVMFAVILWQWLPECDAYLSHNRQLQRLVIILAPVLLYLLSHIAHK